jgi:hypothetical protein
MSVSEDEAKLVADPQNGIMINPRAGVTIMGKTNINCAIKDVHIQGAWRLNPMMQFMIPSTAITPIPTLLWDTPAKGLVQGLKPFMDNLKF